MEKAIDLLLADAATTTSDTSDYALLEPLELEGRLFSLLCHLHTTCATRGGSLLLHSARTVRALSRLLWPRAPKPSGDGVGGAASPRCRRLALRVLVQLSPFVSPEMVSKALTLAAQRAGHNERVGCANLLLTLAGEALGVVDPVGAAAEVPSPSCHVGIGYCTQAHGVDVLAALRDMAAASSEWRAMITSTTLDALNRVMPTLQQLSTMGVVTADIVRSTLASTSVSRGDVARAVGALCLLSGPPQCIRVGGHVRLNTGAVGVVLGFGRGLATVIMAAKDPSSKFDRNAKGVEAGNRVAQAAGGQSVDAGEGRAIVLFDGGPENVAIRDLTAIDDDADAHWLAVDILDEATNPRAATPIEPSGGAGAGAGAGSRGAGSGASTADVSLDVGSVSGNVRRLVSIFNTVLALGTANEDGDGGKDAAAMVMTPRGSKNTTGSMTAGIETRGCALWIAQLKLVRATVIRLLAAGC